MNREKLDTILTGADISAALSMLYGIKDSSIEKLHGGTESQAWRTMEGGLPWIAKIFLSEDERPWLEEECNLYRYLNSHGFHTPVVRLSSKERPIESMQRGGKAFDLIVMKGETLRRAEPSSVTQEEIVSIVQSIARMHQVLLHDPNKIAYQERANVKKPRNEYPESAFEALVQSVHVRHFTDGQRAMFQRTDTSMLAAVRAGIPQDLLTTSIIHGDLALEHAQFLPDGSVYFFDFGDRTWAPVARELGVFLTMLYQWEDISCSRWETLRQWVMDGYESVAPLTPRDVDAIPYFELKRLLSAMSYLATLAKDTESEHVPNWIRRGYELGEYLLTSI